MHNRIIFYGFLQLNAQKCGFPNKEIENFKVRRQQSYNHPKLKPVLDEAINKWLDNGTITNAPVNTAWNSPLTLADKKDANGNKTGKRPCLDPRHINALLPDDKFPIPLITDIFHELSGSSIFTTLDLTAAFHRFKIHDEDQPKTAFTYNGQHCHRSAYQGESRSQR
ncbi:hypothetical protein G6F21_013420 [Rhizopus arrhizus]|nr:hypothetical protein G6F21_013420 [Rhizopus arrhizus]KAG0928624.1 hypothetical protein G6F32_012519 [Rhizopus arrhizus]KAG1087143.1 hypothetical protein G6F40_013783 [Rhizopus arrhizus]